MRENGSAKAWVLAFIAFAGIGMGTLIGVGCLIRANACPFRDQPKQTSRDGAMLFLTNCAACHGRAGVGGRGPSLVAGPVASLSGEELFAKIRRGKPLAGMPRFSRTLEDDQIRAVAAYVQSLRSQPSPSPSPSGAPSGSPS